MKFSRRSVRAAIALLAIILICDLSHAQQASTVAMPEPAPQDAAPDKEGLIRAGQIYYDWKDYRSAIKKWQEALALDPADRKVVALIRDAEKNLGARETVRKPGSRSTGLPKDLARNKALFSFSRKDSGKPRIVAGRQWFNWFQKETNEPQLPPGQVLSVDDCVKIAVRNHIPLQVANDSIKLAELRINENKRNLLPSATVVFESYTGEVNARQYVGRKQYIEGQQPVFRGGELWYLVKQAQTNLEVNKCDYAKIRNELVLQVKKGYYTVGKARENLKIQRALSEEAGKIYGMSKKEAEFNVNSKLEALNVGSQEAQVQYQLAAAEGDVGIAELILKQAMNIDPQEALNIDPRLDFRKVDVNTNESLKAAYRYRPEIKMQTAMLQYYEYGRKIAAAKFWPKIDLLGSWGLAKEEYVSEDRLGPTQTTGALGTNGPQFDVDAKLEQQFYAGVKTSMPFWGSTGEYSWTREQWVPVVSAYQGTEAATNSFKFKVFDRLDVYSDKQQAQIDYDRARQELNKTKQDVALEVQESCFSYEKALLQLGTASDKVKFQEKDLDYTRIRRGFDEVPDSTLLDSLVKLSQEKYGYAQALADCHISLATVNKSIGVEDYYKDEKVSGK